MLNFLLKKKRRRFFTEFFEAPKILRENEQRFFLVKLASLTRIFSDNKITLLKIARFSQFGESTIINQLSPISYRLFPINDRLSSINDRISTFFTSSISQLVSG